MSTSPTRPALVGATAVAVEPPVHAGGCAREEPEGPFTRLTDELVTGCSPHAWVDRTVRAGAAYWYRLGAVANDGGEEMMARAAGRHEATWDGRDESGREVSEGLCYIQVRAGDERITSRVVRVGVELARPSG